eukprot:scaffold145544_cov39-Tisochrysis_lutea.AAC.3
MKAIVFQQIATLSDTLTKEDTWAIFEVDFERNWGCPSFNEEYHGRGAALALSNGNSIWAIRAPQGSV